MKCAARQYHGLPCALVLALTLGACAGSGGNALLTECAADIDSYQGSNCVTVVAGGPQAGQILAPPYVLGDAGMWVNPQFGGTPFRRLVVVATELDPRTRRAVEDAFVAQVKQVSASEARPSYVVVPNANDLSSDALLQSLLASGADGAILVLVTHQDVDLLYGPTIRQSQVNMMEPQSTQAMNGSSPTITDATVQAQLVRLKDPAVVCVGKIHGPGLSPATADAAASAAIGAMQPLGVFR